MRSPTFTEAEKAWLDELEGIMARYAEACVWLWACEAGGALWDLAGDFRAAADWLTKHEAPTARLEQLRRSALRAVEAAGWLALARFARRPRPEVWNAKSKAQRANRAFQAKLEQLAAELAKAAA